MRDVMMVENELKIYYFGGCSAENVAKNIPGRKKFSSAYRIPTACISKSKILIDQNISECDDGDIAKRVSFEASRKYLNVIESDKFDAFIFDFWRDAYVKFIIQGEAPLSVGWEIIKQKELLSDIASSGIDMHTPGSDTYSKYFKDGLSLLKQTLSLHQPKAKIVLLDCPPVRKTMRDGVLMSLERKFDVDTWSTRYLMHYKKALQEYRLTFPHALNFSFPENQHSSPDAPWGEGALHYHPALYEDAGRNVHELIFQTE